ncbi:MAG: glutaredoxin family protein [Candidatus Omnitrophica bacterium]|nr:glutaredoxin family protein [Candidatus Omnitrophota bacterium]
MDITVYSTPTCPYCKLAKQYLSAKGFAYTEVDVSQDEAEAQKMVEVSGQMGVPVVVIDGEVIVGFDKKRIDVLTGK